MSGQPAIPARWRDEGSARQVAARGRRRGVLLLFALVAGLVGAGVALLDWLRPPARCRFVPLFVSGYRADLPPLAWRVQDRDSLLGGSFFSSIDDAPSSLNQATLVSELTALARKQAGSLVVYLSAYARADAAGRVQVLPADCDMDDPVTWLPLEKILTRFRAAPSRQKLLVLDLVAPPAGLKRTVILDDVWACVKADLDAVPDAGRLVLCAAEPGQAALASEVLGQSGFAWYLMDGLRGRGDGNGDGRVNVRELADFVRARVDRWAWRVRGLRQTPGLHGDGGDFTLVDLPNGQPRSPEELPEPRKYPDYLQKGWEKSAPRQSPLLIAAERDWRTGVEDGRVKDAVQAALDALPGIPTATPKARSLALALAGKEPSRDLADALQQVVFQAGPRARGLPVAKAEEARVQLVDAFLKQQPKDASPILLARAALDVAAGDPRPETLKLVAVLVRRLEHEPAYVETLALLRLAALDLPPTVAQRALDAFRGDEQAAARPRLFGWLARDLEAAADSRHEAMVLLEARGYAPQSQGETELATSATRAAAVLALQDVLDDALSARDQARTFLPQCLLYRDRAGLDGPAWLTAARQAVTLSDRLDATKKAGVNGALDDVRRQSALLRTQMEEIGEAFTPGSVSRLLRAAGGASATAGQWRELDGLLATTLVPPAQRASIWSSAIDLARRLEDEVQRLDRHDGAKLNEVPELPDDAPSPQDDARTAVALADLAGASPTERGKLDALVGDRAALAELERLLHNVWRTLPAVESDTGLWAWLADRYRYLARDYGVLSPDSMAATFYSRAAAEYRPWLRSPREEYAEIIETNDPKKLVPGTPITPTFDVRANTIQSAKLDFRLFAPDREWLAVSPDRVRLPSPGVKTTVDGGYLVPVRIELRPGAGEGKAPAPQGVLGRVRLNDDRAYHHLINVPLSPRAPQIVVSLNSQAPTDPLSGIRLRTIPGKQDVFVYLTNPIDKVWTKLQVRMVAGDETRETAAFALGARATKPITFPAGPPAPVTPAAPGAAPPGLPLLQGPLRFEVIDQEKNEVVTRRTVGVDLADPVEYVSVTSVRYDPTGGRNRLSVTLRLRRRMPAPEVNAELGFPAPEDGGATYTTGTLKGKVPADLTELTLFADGVAGREGRALFHISVDGWARAFLFEATLSETGEVTPRQLFAPAVRPRVSAYALSSTSFAVPVEADNAPPGTKLEVTLGRLVAGKYSVEVSDRKETARDKRIGFSPSGPGGALVFEASLHDWVVKMDTTRIRGVRELRAILLDRAGREIAMTPRTLTVGDQAPTLVRFIDPPLKAWRQAPLPLQARGSDSLAGVKAVNFFYGKPVNDKPPPGVSLVPGTAQNESKTLWGVKLPAATDKKGPTEVSVEFVNQFGLSAFATTTVNLEENDPAKTALGKISGKVLEGDRPQGGLTVYLTDDKRAERGKQVSKDDGSFEFDNLPAGKYRLGVEKVVPNKRVGTYPRKGTDFIELTPGGSVTADLSLLLP